MDASEAENWIEYRLPDGRTFRNASTPGPGSFTSAELRAGGLHAIALAANPTVASLRAEGARITEAGPLAPPNLFGGKAA